MSEAQNERWLTYVELGALLRCTPSAARMHARRHGWVRRTSNMIGEQTRVLVPSHAAVQRRTDQRTFAAQMFDATNGQDQANSAAVAVLREQLAIANRLIDELTEERQAAGRRIDDLNEERRCDAEERRRLLAFSNGPRRCQRGGADQRRHGRRPTARTRHPARSLPVAEAVVQLGVGLCAAPCGRRALRTAVGWC